MANSTRSRNTRATGSAWTHASTGSVVGVGAVVVGAIEVVVAREVEEVVSRVV